MIYVHGAPYALAFALGVLVTALLYHKPVPQQSFDVNELPEIWYSIKP
jgi:hypothetical protein